mmetsp:Transcript_32358/g.89422  ORF Transcript_32358/g.89422 Transcript_32358/m.89422 type:complete len:207 (+) Transcript_32358:1888-2508(+)
MCWTCCRATGGCDGKGGRTGIGGGVIKSAAGAGDSGNCVPAAGAGQFDVDVDIGAARGAGVDGTSMLGIGGAAGGAMVEGSGLGREIHCWWAGGGGAVGSEYGLLVAGGCDHKKTVLGCVPIPTGLLAGATISSPGAAGGCTMELPGEIVVTKAVGGRVGGALATPEAGAVSAICPADIDVAVPGAGAGEKAGNTGTTGIDMLPEG